MPMHTTLNADRDLLMELLNHSQVLKELQGDALAREELERLLDISTATCYRYTNRLSEIGMVVESDEEVALTALGDAIAAEVATFEETVRRVLQAADEDRDLLVEITRRAPALEALSKRSLDRRDLEERLDVSQTTGYRATSSLEARGLIEKSNGTYALTPTGTQILDAVSGFEANIRMAIRLGPVLDPLRETGPPVALDAFAEATITTVQGYTHSPQRRFLDLLEETDTLRGFAMADFAPFYLGEILQRLIEGLELEEILRPEFAAQQLAEYPDRAIEICNKSNSTMYLHDDLWYGLALFDDRIGIGVRDADARTLRVFVDSGSPAARTWAEAVYESYKAGAVHLPRLDPISLQQAMEEGSLTDTRLPEV